MINYIFGLEFSNSKEKEQAMMEVSTNSNLSYGDVTPLELEKDNEVFFYKLFSSSNDRNNFEQEIENVKRLLKAKGFNFKTKCLLADPYVDEYRKDECPEFSKFNFVLQNTENCSIELIEKLGDDEKEEKEFIKDIKSKRNKINLFFFTNFQTEFVRGLDYLNLSEKEKNSGKYIISTRIA